MDVRPRGPNPARWGGCVMRDEIDDEFSARLADLLRRIEELPPDRRKQLEREIEELEQLRPPADEASSE